MEGIAEEDSTTSSKSTSPECLILGEEQGHEKIQKKRKLDSTHELFCKLIDVLDKRINDTGPSVMECMVILRKLLTYEDPLFFKAANSFCIRREYREVWMVLESDQERMGWIRYLPENLK